MMTNSREKFLLASDEEKRVYWKNVCSCKNFLTLCSSCDEFTTFYDFEISSKLLNELVSDKDFIQIENYNFFVDLLKK